MHLLQDIFRRRTSNYRALLRKMIHKDKASHGFSQSCIRFRSDHIANTKMYTQMIVHDTDHMLQCVAVCCNVLQCVAVCCSVLQCVAVCCRWFLYTHIQDKIYMQKQDTDVLTCKYTHMCVAECCSVLPCVADVFCIRKYKIQFTCKYKTQMCTHVAVCCSVLQWVAMRCSVLQCVADVFFRHRCAHL